MNSRLLILLATMLLTFLRAAAAITATPSDISAQAENLSAQYEIPAVVIKAVVEQESGWDPNAYAPDGGVGLMQVTPLPSNPSKFSLGSVDRSHANGGNPFTITAHDETVDLDRLRADWLYNMEIGVRILLAKVKISKSDYLDLRILENWYYPLAYYNGGASFNGSNASSNDPINPVYSRTPRKGHDEDWKSKSFFPYQECVFNIIAQKYSIPTSRRPYFGAPIEVILPGPSAVNTGSGKFDFLDASFRFYYFAEFYPNGTAKTGPASSPAIHTNVAFHLTNSRSTTLAFVANGTGVRVPNAAVKWDGQSVGSSDGAGKIRLPSFLCGTKLLEVVKGTLVYRKYFTINCPQTQPSVTPLKTASVSAESSPLASQEIELESTLSCAGVPRSTRFAIGDVVEVFGTEVGLRARFPQPCSDTYYVMPDGSRGTIVAGPECCDGYQRWKVRYEALGTTETWSAEGEPNTGEAFLRKYQAGCSYTLSSAGDHWAAVGGSDGFNVITQPGCSWSARSNADWISLTTPASGSGTTGIHYTVEPNATQSDRAGTVIVGGQIFTVTQNGRSASLNPQSPALIISSPSSDTAYSDVVTIAGTASDGGHGDNGIASVTVNSLSAIGGSASGGGVASWRADISLKPGPNTFTVIATDGAGQSSSYTSTITYRALDPASPRLRIISPNTDLVFTNRITVSGTASDQGLGDNGISSVTVNGVPANGGTASGAGTANWSRDIDLEVGPNTISVIATDATGLSSSNSIVVRYGVFDPQSPDLTVNWPDATVFSNPVTLSGTATDNGFGNTGVTVTVNGLLANGGKANGAGVANWDLPLQLNAGANTITVSAIDGAGLLSADTRTITYRFDPSSPGLRVSTPQRYQVVSTGTITVSGTASDAGFGDNGIASVTVNGIVANGGIAPRSETANWDLQVTLQPGENTITVVAADEAGLNSSDTIVVTYQNLDPQSPRLRVNWPDSIVFSTPVTVSGTSTDNGRGGNGVSVMVNGKTPSGGTAEGSETASWTLPLDLNIGDNTITVSCTDAAGLASTDTKTITFRFDPGSPDLRVLSPSANQIVSTNAITVSGTATDAGVGDNGIKSVTVNGIVANGGRAEAADTALWNLDIELNPGHNSIIVVATDQAGSSSSDTFDVSYIRSNSAPAAPVNISPADGSDDQPLMLSFRASDFSDPDNDSHVASQWILRRGFDDGIEFDSQEDAFNKTAITLAPLQAGTEYTWQVRYKDSRAAWSDYSLETRFTTGGVSNWQPDVWVGFGSERMVGNNVYNSDGVGQTKGANLRRGYSKTCLFMVQNDGAFSQNFTVRGSGSERGRYHVYYRAGGVDITARVVAGTFRVENLVPGERRTIKAIFVPALRATPGDQFDVELGVRSANSEAADAARVRVHVR